MNKEAVKLLEEMAQLFHNLVAKILYLSHRTRQELQMAVAFLCTKVQSLDVDNYKKLARLMQYQHTTRDLTLTLPELVGRQFLCNTPIHA